jgi:hypothetical protein
LHIAIVSSDLTDHIVGHGIASLLKIWHTQKQQTQAQKQQTQAQKQQTQAQKQQLRVPRVTIVPLTAHDGSDAGAACRAYAHSVIDGSRLV